MGWRSFLLAIGLAASFATMVEAQDNQVTNQVFVKMQGTLSAIYSPSFSAGKPVGCAIEYTALVLDWAYLSGRPVRLGGSFGFIKGEHDGRTVIGPFLKVVLHDMDPATFALTPNPPVATYAVVKDRSNAGSEAGSYPSDTPGALFTAFQISPSTELFVDALREGKLTVAYARKKGGMDVRTEIDLTVVSTDNTGGRQHSGETIDKMLDCSMSLFKSLKE